MKKIIGYITFGIVIIGFYLLINRYINNENKKIFNNPGYAIGELTYFSDYKNPIGVPRLVTVPAKPSEIQYKYLINGKEFKNKYDDGIFKMPFSGPTAGESYLVIYLKSNPEKSLMLFDYPIKNSSDFTRYMKEFKSNPPKL